MTWSWHRLTPGELRLEPGELRRLEEEAIRILHGSVGTMTVYREELGDLEVDRVRCQVNGLDLQTGCVKGGG